jgi:hypothetical protein
MIWLRESCVRQFLHSHRQAPRSGAGRVSLRCRLPHAPLMNVIPITLAISLCLTLTFILFFWREQTRRRYGSAESDALMPLADDAPAAAPLVLELKDRVPGRVRGACGRAHAHGHVHDAEHPPCEGCAHRFAHGRHHD